MAVKKPILLAVLLVLGTAACTDNGSTDAGAPGPGATPAPSVAPTTSAMPAPSAPACATGRWSAIAVNSSGGFGSVAGRIAGGAGVTMDIDPDGATEVGFAGSRPLTFAAEAAGATLKGEVQYSGSLRGGVNFVPQDSAGSGTWEPHLNSGDNDLRATVKLIEPISVTLLDNARLTRVAGEQLGNAGDAVDIQPILRGGTYRCADDTLRVQTRDDGPNVVWTFSRV